MGQSGEQLTPEVVGSNPARCSVGLFPFLSHRYTGGATSLIYQPTHKFLAEQLVGKIYMHRLGFKIFSGEILLHC